MEAVGHADSGLAHRQIEKGSSLWTGLFYCSGESLIIEAFTFMRTLSSAAWPVTPTFCLSGYVKTLILPHSEFMSVELCLARDL